MLKGIVLALIGGFPTDAATPAERKAPEVRAALEQAGAFFRDKLSTDGSYVWAYSVDLSKRRGEGEVGRHVGWTQPPGTPAVGAAFLEIYRVTGDEQWLRAAERTATVLINAQLLSGGWFQFFPTSAEARTKWCFRSSGITQEGCEAIEGNKNKNTTLLDDNTTQGVLAFLIWFDELSEGRNKAVGEAISYALDRLISLQYPNGAWPVVSVHKGNADGVGAGKRAALPRGKWPKEYVKPGAVGPYFILNDHAMRDVTHVFLAAERVYNRPIYLDAAVRAGEFLLAAQLPEPQAGWAQTYDRTMVPVWGRKFEPPAVASKESAGAIEALLALYARTRQERLLLAARSACKWLIAARLPSGEWARFYEFKTNRPIYVDTFNRVTYTDGSLLRHYGLKGDFGISHVLERFQAAERNPEAGALQTWPLSARSESNSLLHIVDDRVQSLDPMGRWVEGNWILSDTFIQATFAMGAYLNAH